MLKIAITGGIGSGKSTVSKIISDLNYKVYDVDKIYAEIVAENEIVLSISNLVGVAPKDNEGKLELDRKAISEKVFNNKLLLDKLNKYTHKLVYDKISQIIQNETNEQMIFFEIPLLFESGGDKLFDKVIVVMRDKYQRIEALKERNGYTDQEAEERIKNQIDYDNFDLTKHTLIYNNNDFDSLKSKVIDVIQNFKE